MEITPKPIQQPMPFYVACFSGTSMTMAAERGLNIIFAPFAAAMMYGGLGPAVVQYREACAKTGIEDHPFDRLTGGERFLIIRDKTSVDPAHES